jgi:hypothetical protein
VDNTSILIKHTFYGDANLDGAVNLTDFNRVAANWGATALPAWSRGNFDYNDIVNLSDFNKLAANFGAGVAGPDGSPARGGERLPSLEELVRHLPHDEV